MSLKLSGFVHTRPEKEDLFDDLAGVLMRSAIDAVEQRGVFHIALSGGSTPEPFYMLLITDPRLRAIPWQQTHIWIVDERRVAADDERYNYRMICESLVDHLPMRDRQKHPMPVLIDDPATQYENDIHELVDDQRLDFVLLGMGDDAHTASIFPNSAAVDVRDRLIVVNDGENVTPPDRVTMTYSLLNKARELAVLATGQKKTATLKAVDQQLQNGGPDPTKMPITGIDPEDGELTWYLDGAAAGE